MRCEKMKTDEIMEQAQVFASAWSLVGGRFDNGSMLTEAEEAKAELRQMIQAALKEREGYQVRQVKSSVGESVWIDVSDSEFALAIEHRSVTRIVYTAPPKAQPMSDAIFLERLLREGSQELVGLTTFVNNSIQGGGRVQLLASAVLIRDFIYRCHKIGE